MEFARPTGVIGFARRTEGKGRRLPPAALFGGPGAQGAGSRLIHFAVCVGDDAVAVEGGLRRDEAVAKVLGDKFGGTAEWVSEPAAALSPDAKHVAGRQLQHID